MRRTYAVAIIVLLSFAFLVNTKIEAADQPTSFIEYNFVIDSPETVKEKEIFVVKYALEITIPGWMIKEPQNNGGGGSYGVSIEYGFDYDHKRLRLIEWIWGAHVLSGEFTFEAKDLPVGSLGMKTSITFYFLISTETGYSLEASHECVIEIKPEMFVGGFWFITPIIFAVFYGLIFKKERNRLANERINAQKKES